MSDHFRIEKIVPPIQVPTSAKVFLRWAVICVVTGGRVAARRTRAEAETAAAILSGDGCWCCAERKRPDGLIKEVGDALPS